MRTVKKIICGIDGKASIPLGAEIIGVDSEGITLFIVCLIDGVVGAIVERQFISVKAEDTIHETVRVDYIDYAPKLDRYVFEVVK